MNARVTELFGDQEFVKKIISMNGVDAQRAIEAEGGEISLDELHDLATTVNDCIQKINESNGELDVEDLDAIAGGGKVGAGILLGGCIGAYAGGFVGAVAGGIVGGIVGAVIPW